MRISDWSSDVCSSDLVPIVTALGARPRSHASVSVADMTLQREWRVGNGGVQIGIGIDAVVIAERVLATPGIVQTNLCVDWTQAARQRDIGFEEIGRASCRERVCQYV